MEKTKGYIKLWRKIKESPIYNTPPKCRLLWYEILLRANYKKCHKWIGAEKVELNEGELLATYSEMAEWIGASKSTVSRFVDIFHDETMIETQRETAGKFRKTRFKVVNWAKYQGSENVEKRSETQDEIAIERSTKPQSNAGSNDNNNKNKRNKEKKEDNTKGQGPFNGERPRTWDQWKNYLNNPPDGLNDVSVLGEMIKTYFPDNPDPDYGLLGQCMKAHNKWNVAREIFELQTRPSGPNGQVEKYINKTLNNQGRSGIDEIPYAQRRERDK